MINKADKVRELAYRIWESQGRPHGREGDHWLEAERRLAGAGVEPKRRTRSPARASEGEVSTPVAAAKPAVKRRKASAQ